MQNLEERCKLQDHQNCVCGWAYSSKERYSSFFIIRFSRLNASSHPSAKLVGPSCQQTHKLDIDDLGNDVTFQPKGGDFSTNHLMHRTSLSQFQINQHHEMMNASLLKQMGYSLFNLYFNICKLFSANSWTSLSALKIYVFINMLHWPMHVVTSKFQFVRNITVDPLVFVICLLVWSDWIMN